MPQQGGKDSPKHLPSLPAEIWLHVFQLVENRDNILSLASVNKLMRGVASPFLFGTILLSSFKWNKYTRFAPCEYLRELIQWIQYINTRPYVLNYVRKLILIDWWIFCGDDMPDDPADSDINFTNDNDFADYSDARREFVELRNIASRELVAFIFNLPGLLRLQIHDGSFTPEFTFRILCIPSLRSLNIYDHRIIPSTSTFKVAVVTPSLRVFEVDTRYAYGPESEIVELLISIIGQLTVLSLSSSILCRLCVDKGLPTTLTRLQKLSITFNRDYMAPDNQEIFECIHSFLRLTPNLRELCVGGNVDIETPSIRSHTTVHNLALSASSHIANKLSLGLFPESSIFTL